MTEQPLVEDLTDPAAPLHRGVLVACPDARPPAYEAVAGLAQANRLHSFHTSFYAGSWINWLPAGSRLTRRLGRRRHLGIPSSRVRSHSWVDLALALERRSASASLFRKRLVRERTDRFDRVLARALARSHPDHALVFSDVASEHALPVCRSDGIPSMLSMVHGDVIEEREVLAIEQERSPEFFEIYLADGPIDRDELDWLHDRRLADIELADTILVPSAHIARRLVDVHGLAPTRVHILPYAADIERFRPAADKRHDPNRCVFLFAGGITARKGIHDLLDAWLRIKRGGWKLQLLGPLPANTRPLEPYLAHVELLGRIGHADMCCHMANADVFVFPSLFEGSAVVTYEALACGLPSVVTAESGAVVRDSIEGFLVPARDPETLAIRMETIGRDPQLRSQMARNARARALQFGWRRYSASLLEILSTGKGASSISPSSVGQGTRTDHNPKSQYEECSV